MVTTCRSTLALLLLLLGAGPHLIGRVTGEETAAGQQQQITTITTSSSEPCAFNRFCTCVTETVQSITPHSDAVQLDSNLEAANSSSDDLLNVLHLEQSADTIYSHSKLYEITCLNSPFYSVPKLPGGHLYRLNLIGSRQLSRIKAFSFIQSQISSITISRSKVQVLLRNFLFYSEPDILAPKYPFKSFSFLPLCLGLGHRQRCISWQRVDVDYARSES